MTTQAKDFSERFNLATGKVILVRTVCPGDKERFRDAFNRLETRSVYTRFFGFKKELTESELEEAVAVDFDRTVALVATVGSGDMERIIGGGRYVRSADPASPDCAELAFTVDDDYQRQGIAGHLLNCLVQIGRSAGLRQFDAHVLPENQPMLAVFSRSRLPMRQQSLHGEVCITLDLV